jgi:hypothetical protein
MAAPKLWTEFQEHRERAETQAEQSAQVSGDTELPNVYYYLYDEYAGPKCLEYFYEYDNSAFYEALENRGFQCSMDSYNTQSDVTVRLVPEHTTLAMMCRPTLRAVTERPHGSIRSLRTWAIR